MKFVETKKNKIADALSRSQFRRFSKLAVKKGMNTYPDAISKEIWPIEHIWKLDD